MNLWQWIIVIIFAINFIGAIYTVFHEERDVPTTWAWLLTLAFIPVFGFILYTFIGKKIPADKIYDIKTQKSLGMSELAGYQKEMLEENDQVITDDESEVKRHTAILFLESNESILTSGNKVEVMIDNVAKFEKIIEDIMNAQHHVHLLYYTFRSDDLGKRIVAALENRAAAGVEVLVVFDALGCRGNHPKFFKRLEELGGKTLVFFGSRIPFVNLRMNYRNHRKIIVVDSKVAYMGGYNIGNEYIGEGRLGNWRDSHIRIQGNAVLTLQSRFFMDWNAVASKHEQRAYDEEYFPISPKIGDTAMQIVSSGPGDDIQSIKMGFIRMISQAKQSIYIQTPYFIPDNSVHEILKMSALSGVDVNIMIPCKPDHPFVYRATEYFAKDIIKYGAKVYVYDDGFFHSKVLIVDGEVASIGSANMDVRSFKLNFEINSFIYDDTIAMELQTNFINDLEKSFIADEAYFENQSTWRKFKQYFSRLLSPIL